MEEIKQCEGGSVNFLLDDCIGAKLVRVYKNPGRPLNLSALKLCFDNGKSFTLNARISLADHGIRPYLKYEQGQWEMVEAEKEGKDES